MAVHDGEHVVSAALESIAAQTWRDWEAVVVDDGSTDGTPAVLRSWAERDRRVRVLRRDINRGLASSLNHAFAHARGDLLARMDDDDVSFPQRLERQVDFLDTHPQVAVVGTGAEMVDGDGTPLGTLLLPERHEELAARIYRTNPLIHPSVMLRRSFLVALDGYDARLRRAEDADLWLRGYRTFRYHNLQEPLLRYRERRRPLARDAFIGAWVLGRAAWREGQPLSKGGYAARFLVGTLAGTVGLTGRRLPRPARS